jgi:hypothetical protein
VPLRQRAKTVPRYVAMFDGLEEFFAAHDATTRALGVLGTFLAIVTSLALALVSQRANRTRLKTGATFQFTFHH